MSYESFAGVLIEALPPGTFATVVTGDRVAQGKPDPEAYLTAMAELGAEPGECVAIEDSVPGVRAAVAAGVPTIAVPHVIQVPHIDGAVRLDSLVGLTPEKLRLLATGR
jgi:beta-phosphoglucomutase-like phosphatase (HAD superfamily)